MWILVHQTLQILQDQQIQQIQQDQQVLYLKNAGLIDRAERN